MVQATVVVVVVVVEVDVVAVEFVVVVVVVVVVLVDVIGGAVAGAGSVSRCAVAERVNATFVPPKNGLRIGVRSWNRPVTLTVIRLPIPVGHPDWLQLTAMSAGLTRMPLPLSSS